MNSLGARQTTMSSRTRDQSNLSRRSLIVIAILGLVAPRLRADDDPKPRTKFSPTERMMRAHLKKTHDDVERIQRSRRSLPPSPGLNDYRAILHAHAEDSAHTGGTRPEMLADAHRANVHAILLSDHHRPPKDFINDSWRGLHEGVLFVPGSEDRGFLLLPTHSIMDKMREPVPRLIEAVRADGGLILLSHIEERPDHPMTNLDGMEIYNRHADAKKDRAGLIALGLKLTDPASLRELEESLRDYPDEMLAAQLEYPADYLAKWDGETKTRRLVGVSANDCHHNQVLIVKMVDSDTVKIGTNVDADDRMSAFSATVRPGIRELTKGRKAGDVLARLDFDPYFRSFRDSSTHILAPELTELAIRAALRGGHAYVSHDWMCNPTGFQFELTAPAAESENAKETRRVVMGDEIRFSTPMRLVARFPVSCHVRLVDGGRVIAERTGDTFEHEISQPGVYRVEAWLDLAGERRGWIYSNPIYVR
jgi:hypothetical protein